MKSNENGKIELHSQDYYDFLYGLCRLFEEIDINGDNSL